MDIDIRPQDLSITTVIGGSSWFPTTSGVKITHIPTQCSVVCTQERSQHKNKQIAMERLVEKLKTWVAPIIQLTAYEMIDIIARECRSGCHDKDHAIAYFDRYYAGRFEKDYLHCIIHIIDFDALRQVDGLLQVG